MVFPSSAHSMSSISVVANRLTDRDRTICEYLYEHRVLTTDHIKDLAFRSVITAQHRLQKLVEMRVIDRFRPYRVSKATPFHYVLHDIGAMVVAADRGVDVKELDWKPGRAIALAGSSHLDHLVGVNGFFSSLHAAGRSLQNAELTEWWSARRCGGEWGKFVIADGFGVWRDGDTELQFFLEYDRGTESLRRLHDKVSRYRDLMYAMGSKTPVLFVFPGLRREAGLRRAIRSLDIPIATAVAGTTPNESVWLAGENERRVNLRELAHWSVAMT